jgi:tetratricopeptide (TPR) repeat protein
MSEGQPTGPSAEARSRLDLALAAHQAGRLDEAARLYLAVLEIAPADHNALTNLGTVALQQGRLDEGVALIERSLAIRPDQSNAINNRGNALLSLKRMDEALAAFDRAVEIDPHNAEAHSNRGVALIDLGRPDEAAAAYEAALAIKPGFLDALNGLGIAMEALGRPEGALEVYDRSLAVAPGSWELHYNRGNALRGLNRPAEAAAAYGRSLAIQSTAGAYANRGVALQAMGEFDAAMEDWARATALEPEHADARWNRALLMLLRGDYAQGWAQYEWRWGQPSFRDSQTPVGPKWLGETPLAGKRLLMVTEQGFGDALQMMRYAGLAVAQGGSVVMIVDPALAELAASTPGVDQVVSGGEPITYDFWTPMMSLPLAFGTTLATVPADVPYIAAPPEKRAAWAERLGERRRPRVGLVWSGRASHGNDANRSIPLDVLAPLLAADVEFISLQTEYREADRARLAELPIRDVSADLRSFGDTAALIEALDMVVSVDTSVAHLAGALGKPLRVLLPFVPDFRWGLNSETTPWYPTARLLRQPARGDWRPVIAAAMAEIAALTG